MFSLLLTSVRHEDADQLCTHLCFCKRAQSEQRGVQNSNGPVSTLEWPWPHAFQVFHVGTLFNIRLKSISSPRWEVVKYLLPTDVQPYLHISFIQGHGSPEPTGCSSVVEGRVWYATCPGLLPILSGQPDGEASSCPEAAKGPGKDKSWVCHVFYKSIKSLLYCLLMKYTDPALYNSKALIFLLWQSSVQLFCPL